MSAVSVGELYTWALRSKASASRVEVLRDLLRGVTFLDVSGDVACKFGEIRAQLLDQGQPVAPMDLLIAATALVHGLTLVTHNVRDFANIPCLPTDGRRKRSLKSIRAWKRPMCVSA